MVCGGFWNPFSELNFWKPTCSRFLDSVFQIKMFLETDGQYFLETGFRNCSNLEIGVYEILHPSFQKMMKLETGVHKILQNIFWRELKSVTVVRTKIRRWCTFHVLFGIRRLRKTRRRFPLHSSAVGLWRYGIRHEDGDLCLGYQNGAFTTLNWSYLEDGFPITGELILLLSYLKPKTKTKANVTLN